MKKLNTFDLFKIYEAEENGIVDENPKRSERLLTQAQKEYTDDTENYESSGPMPVMMFTDVEGSSKMWSDDPIKMSQQLESHHKLVQSLSEKYNGWIVKTIGDAFMVYFEPSEDSIINALNCAKEIIQSEKAYGLRIGVCHGPMEQKTYRIQKVDLKDFYGNTVNTASRMESKVSGAAGVIAFCSTKDLGNKIGSIKTIGPVESVDLSKYELRGVTIEKAYKMEIK